VDSVDPLSEFLLFIMQLTGLAEPLLYMENGRFVTGPYGWLVARCEVTKT